MCLGLFIMTLSPELVQRLPGRSLGLCLTPDSGLKDVYFRYRLFTTGNRLVCLYGDNTVTFHIGLAYNIGVGRTCVRLCHYVHTATVRTNKI